ncbi:MAG: PatB family C-S lyase [Thermodesulfobacteriota bacterium]
MERVESSLFDAPIDRYGTASEKWERYGGRNVIPLWLADMDFKSPSPVLAALHRRVDHGVFGYTRAPSELVDVLQESLLRSYGWAIEPEWIVWLPGLVTGLNVACRAVGADGDLVATSVPVYPPFLSAPRYSRKQIVTVPMIQDSGRWRFDMDGLNSSLPPRTSLFLLCSPHNPCGRVFTREELLDLAELCERKGAVICSDEIHCDLVLDQTARHIPTATLAPEIASRTITLMAPSKTYNLPGLGIGFAIISDRELRARFKRAMAGIVPGVNALAFTAALAAYRDGAEWLEALLSYLRRNRDFVQEVVGKIPGLSMSHVEATYLAWLDARSMGLADPAQFFERAGVGLGSGDLFGMPGFVRLSFGSPRSLVEEALARMRTAAEAWTSR